MKYQKLPFLLALTFAACASTEPLPPANGPLPPATGPMVVVATLGNPSLSPEDDRAMQLVGDALDAAGVEWVAAGSRGYSVNVHESQAARAREVLREVVARGDVPVQIVER